MKTAAAILSALLLTGCATGTGSKWYAPATWLSGHAASAVVRAEAKAEKAETKADAAADSVVHSANVETAKAGIALAAVPAGRARDAAARFNANASGLLSQVTPLTAAESAELRQLVADLLSENQHTAADAEARQRAAESELSRLSNELTEANAKVASAHQSLADKNAALRSAFSRENELANELRAQRARFWIVVGVAVVLLGFGIYARLALGGVGAALHAAGAPAQVVSAIDSNLSTFGQWLIRTGRTAAAKAEAALSVAQDNTNPPAK